MTVDLPVEQHVYLKMLAAKAGISMRQYIIDALTKKIELDGVHISLGENRFKKLALAVIEKNDEMLK